PVWQSEMPQEIKSLLSCFGGQFSPFWILSIPSEDTARNSMRWTVCAKSICELWGPGQSPEEPYSSLKNYPVEKMVPFLHSDSTYKIKIHIYACKFLLFQEKVNLKKWQHIFSVLEDCGLDPNCIPENPHNIYFGRWIADGQRELTGSYSVKTGRFAGNTSVDAGLSFIMANHGKVKENDIVFDPFVQTAVYYGLMITSAHFGAYVYGADTDYSTERKQIWKGPEENIRANLCQYGLQKYYLDVLVSEASKPSWRKGTYVDAVITDPPHGIRESTRTGSQKEIYHLSDMFVDLLNFAAETLGLGGRLVVYWLPVYTPEYTEEMVPWHLGVKLVSNREQKLSRHSSRRLITMEKVKKFENRDQYSCLLSDRFLPYQGHNCFHEKYFSGMTEFPRKNNPARNEN
uniref:tRNA (guanine(10)-N(2))-methyltransferase TRMT11 N-terminal domain-containing protein n=1 Tax=Cebus imitator TaxID=2715852 RepID=A0A2K5RJD9_CEBIM